MWSLQPCIYFSQIYMRLEDCLRFLIFTIWPYWLLPCVWTPDPGAMNFTILVEGSKDIITMHLVFLTCGSRENNFWKFGLFLHTWPRLCGPRGSKAMNFIFDIPLTINMIEMLLIKKVPIGLVVFKNFLKMYNC